MQRRRFVAALGNLSASTIAGSVMGGLGISASGTSTAQSGHYAESVAMTAHSEDALTSFDVRIARFPDRGTGTLWLYAFVDGHQYSLVDESVRLSNPGITPVEAPDAEFAVTGDARALLRGANRHSADMTGFLDASGVTHATPHPPVGAGNLPLTVRAAFAADHSPIQVRAGRIEVMGSVTATVTTPYGEHQLRMPGKWHEQIGQRARFAPAFTYLFVQGPRIGVMCTKHAQGAWGYVFDRGDIVLIDAMQIEPYGQPVRQFTASLANGSTLEGAATVVREVSVPIEGRRRPGATVIVESSLGRMVGVLNDWDPG